MVQWRGFEPISNFPILIRFPVRILGNCQAHRLDHSLIREVELPVQVQMLPGGNRTARNRFDQFRPAS